MGGIVNFIELICILDMSKLHCVEYPAHSTSAMKLAHMQKYIPILFIVLLVTTSACNNSGGSKNGAPDTVVYYYQDTFAEGKDSSLTVTSEYFDDSATVLIEDFNDTAYQFFSDSSSNDMFVFHIPKGHISKTRARIDIINSKGESVYWEEFPSNAIVYGYATSGVKNDSEMLALFLEYANEMLDTSSFIKAEKRGSYFLETSTYDEFQDYGTFKECGKEKRKLFVISLYEEYIRYLGFSRKKKDVVVVIDCC